MHLELKHYKAFIVLAKTLHFGRAAEQLNMAQPQLSRLVKFIESEVGTDLLSRTTRKITLTPAGEIFLEQGLMLIRQAENSIIATRKAAEGFLGSVRVSYMDFAIGGPLPRILRSFRHKHKNIDIVLHHMWTEQQRRALLERTIDVGFMIGPFDHPEIASIPVSFEKLMVVLPESHPMASLAEINLRDLADEPFIFGTASSWRPFLDIVERICLHHGFLPRVVQEPFNTDAIFGLVSAQLGVTIYPERPFSMYPRGVVVRPIQGVGDQVCTIAAWDKRNASKTLVNFLDVTRQFSYKPPEANI